MIQGIDWGEIITHTLKVYNKNKYGYENIAFNLYFYKKSANFFDAVKSWGVEVLTLITGRGVSEECQTLADHEHVKRLAPSKQFTMS